MSFKMHENCNFDQIFVERSENDGSVFNMKLALDTKVRNSAFQNISSAGIYDNSVSVNIACDNKRSF